MPPSDSTTTNKKRRGESSKAFLARGRVMFACPTCTTEIGLSKESGHTLTMTSTGVVVSPGWSCPECGLVGKVKHNEVIVVGRVSVPPSGAVVALHPLHPRPAVKIRPIPEEDLPQVPHEAVTGPDNCPQKRSHGYYGRARKKCPVCGTGWPITDDGEDLFEEGEDVGVGDVDDPDEGDGGDSPPPPTDS